LSPTTAKLMVFKLVIAASNTWRRLKVGTVIVDEDGIYDPRHPNDRLLLGMKGTMSELELSLFRQRSQEALKQKARRGALFLSVAAGYLTTGRDRIEKDPDQRVQDALRMVFAKFAELQSVRQVHVWLREEGIAMPTACHSTSEGRSIVWRLPLYNTVHNILTNPVYAGAYAFGRTMSKVSVEEGRKRVRRGVRRPLAEWDVLLKDQHEGYISWVEFERNQRFGTTRPKPLPAFAVGSSACLMPPRRKGYATARIQRVGEVISINMQRISSGLETDHSQQTFRSVIQIGDL
jgi:hypothetical protein